MAKVIKKKSRLVQKRNRQMLVHMGGYVLCLLGGALAAVLGFAYGSFWLVWLFALSSLAGLAVACLTRNGVSVLSAGVCGEEDARAMLAKALPDTFCCITNAQIFYENRHNELDLIVLGPSGIYVVEVKNVSGRIMGAYSDKVLCQQKRQEDKQMRSPVYQVRRQVDILWRYLRAKGIRAWVQGVVLFINPKASVCITDIPAEGIPIFAVSQGGGEGLAQYLTRPVPNPLTREELRRIRKVIRKARGK